MKKLFHKSYQNNQSKLNSLYPVSHHFIYHMRSYNSSVFKQFWSMFLFALSQIERQHLVFEKNTLKTKNANFSNKLNQTWDFKSTNKFYKHFTAFLRLKSRDIFGSRLSLVKYRTLSIPIKIRRFTLLKSAHVHKSSRDQFEIRTHSNAYHLYVQNTSVSRFISLFNRYFLGENLPINIQLAIKEMQLHKVGLSVRS